MPAPHEEQLQLRIRELEKEVAHLHYQIKQQRYGLNWIDVPEAFDKESENKIPTLEEVPELSFKTDDGKPTHILIEGDNYHALTCLNYTHRGKVDVIYIDPPYNTGSDGFIYKDKRMLDRYPDGTPVPVGSPQRHSYWLSFMHRRLELAKNLLSERGVILISIDDNEQANLKLLCDEVFGSSQKVGQLIWQKRKGGGNDSVFIGTDHEYIVVYKKRIRTNEEKWRVPYDEKYLKRYKFEDKNGRYYYDTLSRPGLNNPIIYDVICPDGSVIKDGTWQISKETFEEGLRTGEINFVKNKNGGFTVMRKVRVPEEGKVFRSIITNVSNKDAADDMERVMGNKRAFSNPKPLFLVKQLLTLPFSSTDLTILDFFAGSGTTLHATMNLNEEDGGKRQCILVQYPEKTWEIINGKKKAKKGSEDAFKYGFDNITEITYERNRRVMQGYTDAKGNEVEGLGNSLKYYRTAFVGVNDAKHANEQDRLLLSQKAGCLLALAENTLDETLRTSHYQLFTDGTRLTAVYFKEDLRLFDEFVEHVRNAAKPASVYVFCWGSADEFQYNFEGIADVSLKSIPEPILKIYQTLNP